MASRAARVGDGSDRARRPRRRALQTSALPEAITLLREALTAWPDDDTLLRRLAIAHALELEYHEPLTVVEPYPERHPADHTALLLTLSTMFSGHVDGSAALDGEALNGCGRTQTRTGPRKGRTWGWSSTGSGS